MSCAGNHDKSRACDHDAAFSDYVLTRGTALLRMATMLTGNRADAKTSCRRPWPRLPGVEQDQRSRRARRLCPAGDGQYPHIVVAPPPLEEFPTDELPDQAVADHARESDTAEVVRRALDRLPQRMRTAVMLRYFEDMTEPEIAAALGISLGTVKSTVSRAVAKLRIDAELGEDSGARPFGRAAHSAALRTVRPGARGGSREGHNRAPLATPAPLRALLRAPEQLIPMIAKTFWSVGALARISGSGALYGELLPIVAAVGHGGWPAPMRMN